jgi:hypothetical protein
VPGLFLAGDWIETGFRAQSRARAARRPLAAAIGTAAIANRRNRRNLPSAVCNEVRRHSLQEIALKGRTAVVRRPARAQHREATSDLDIAECAS